MRRPPSVFDLAAVYGTGIVRSRPFIDGKKRVALMVIYAFLDLNGYRLEAPEVEAAGVMLSLAAGEVDERALSGWIKQYSVPIVQGGIPIESGVPQRLHDGDLDRGSLHGGRLSGRSCSARRR
jgi:hypothetical protein